MKKARKKKKSYDISDGPTRAPVEEHTLKLTDILEQLFHDKVYAESTEVSFERFHSRITLHLRIDDPLVIYNPEELLHPDITAILRANQTAHEMRTDGNGNEDEG